MSKCGVDMKKILVFVLAVMLAFSSVSCSKEKELPANELAEIVMDKLTTTIRRNNQRW